MTVVVPVAYRPAHEPTASYLLSIERNVNAPGISACLVRRARSVCRAAENGSPQCTCLALHVACMHIRM